MPSETHTVCPPGMVALFEDLFAGKNEKLAVVMILTSMIDLTRQDIIDLKFEQKKRRFGLGASTKVSVTKKKDLPNDPICDRMAEALSGEEQSISTVIRNLWGQISWSEHRRVIDPFEDVEGWVKEEMVNQGFMETVKTKGRFGLERKTYEAVLEKVNPLESEAKRLKKQMDQFKSQSPDLYKELVKEIRKGILSREPVDTGVAE